MQVGCIVKSNFRCPKSRLVENRRRATLKSLSMICVKRSLQDLEVDVALSVSVVILKFALRLDHDLLAGLKPFWSHILIDEIDVP